MNNKPRLTCWGGVGAVTGADFLFEVGGKKMLIDCGLFQGPKVVHTEVPEFMYKPETIDYLFVTHAHVDHIGRIHHLVRAGFKGVIYSTSETREIAELMLQDLIHISGEDEALIERPFELWQTLNYHEPKDFGGFTLELLNAGHILGSAMYKFTLPSGKSILFTGDLGNSSSTFFPHTDKVEGLTYLLMDSVYGDRNHEPKAERDGKFKLVIGEAIKRGGTILMPVFSLERTQVMLHELDKLIESKQIPSVPVFLDSPLAIKLTAIYERVYGRENFTFPKFVETRSVRDSMEIENTKGAKIILAGSGMSTAGRILRHEAVYLPDPMTTILFVGYQVPGTLGRMIQEGMKEVVIDGAKVPVRAHIETIHGFSAHKDSEHLIEFVADTASTLERVFVAMGEPKSSIFLAQCLRDEFNIDAIVPERGKVYELDL